MGVHYVYRYEDSIMKTTNTVCKSGEVKREPDGRGLEVFTIETLTMSLNNKVKASHCGTNRRKIIVNHLEGIGQLKNMRKERSNRVGEEMVCTSSSCGAPAFPSGREAKIFTTRTMEKVDA
jgi:hypothetical protein